MPVVHQHLLDCLLSCNAPLSGCGQEPCALCSLQKDLTAELREAKTKAERRIQEAAATAAATARNVQADVPPTQGEARRWLRSGRYSRKAVATPTPAESVALAVEAAAEQERYDRLKDQLQNWCLGTALVCFGATVVFYSKVRPLLCLCKYSCMQTDHDLNDRVLDMLGGCN